MSEMFILTDWGVDGVSPQGGGSGSGSVHLLKRVEIRLQLSVNSDLPVMSPHRKRPSPNRLNWLLILVFSTVILGIFYGLASLGPRSSGSGSGNRVADQAALALLEQSKDLEKQFDELLIQGIIEREDLVVLFRAINFQKEYIAALPARDFIAENRLELLEKRYNEYMGEILAREAQRLEAEARALEGSGESLMVLREALAIREQIRDQYGTSSRNDVARLSRLQREVQIMEILPVYDKSVLLEEEAATLVENGDLERAVRKYADAAQLQEEINRAYPGLSLSKPLRASRLREKEAEVLSGELRRQIDELITEANDAIYARNFEGAASALSRAREMQRNLNLQFPKSPYVSRGREDRLRVRAQNAGAYLNYERLGDLEGLLNRSLRDGNFQEANLLISQLSDRLSQFDLRYSLSTLPIEQLANRVSYLGRKDRFLEAIRSSIQADLLSMPGDSAKKILATEVPQYLYEMVMDTNPSRNTGGDLPVETISLAEVEQFLQRVGWVLAQEARLPTVAEFREAAAEAVAADELEVLSSGSGSNQPRPVQSLRPDPAGLFHILGNVSELVRITEGSTAIAHIGGNLRTIRSQIIELEPTPMEIGERNRMVGFRFVVETDQFPTTLPENPEI